jgi:transposase
MVETFTGISNSRAHKALLYIRRIYEIESSLSGKELSDDEFVRQRKGAAVPILNEFHAWLMKTNREILPKSSTGKAVSYALNEWSKLLRYLDEAFLTPDNNAAENAIRPFVVGRKNWLFSNTPRGAHASAAMYSLVESAKANKLEPYAYLKFLFSRLPDAGNDPESLRALLPCYLTPEDCMRGI